MNIIENAQVCNLAFSCLHDSEQNLAALPGLMRRIIEEEMWRDRQLSPSRRATFDTFREFIVSPPLDGWNEDPDKIESLLRDDPEVLVMFREAMTGKHGGDHGNQYTGGKSNNIRLAKTAVGTRRDYTLIRLKNQHAELYERVVAGELSANAAAIEAGIRPKTVSVRLDNVASIARTLRRHLSDEALVGLIAELGQPGGNE